MPDIPAWLRRVAAGLVVACCLLGASASAQVPDPFAGLSQTSFNAVAASVTTLAASGAPRAQAVITALGERRLYAARTGDALYIRNGSDYVDARSGAPARPDPDTIRSVRVNNRIREAVAGALALFGLTSSDPAIRLRSADAAYDSHDPAALPVLDRALAHEADAGVVHRLREARAAALLSAPGQAGKPGDAGAVQERIDAVRILAASGGLPARAILAGLHDQPAAVQAAVAQALSSIDLRLRLWSVAQDLFYGLSLGSVLLLAAMGLAITFGVMGVINMAHGEVMMIGAYTTWMVQQAVAAAMPALAPVSILLAIPAAFLVCGAIGVAIERGLIRFLYGRPLETLLATWGLSLVLQQAIRSLFGPTNISVVTPGWLSGSLHWGGLVITLNRLAIMIFAVLVMGALSLVLRRTSLGLEMRAVTQNRRMAALMGIRTPRVDALTFGLGSGVAGLAGVAISQIDNVSPNLGQGYIIDSFMVVVFGGVGNLWGTLAGATTLGIANKILEPVAGAVLGKIVVLVLLILFIQRRPRGMFPLKGRGVES
ncbi:urea ABC transporter permease subunit UrtB [Lichenicoccus roseus]|uniref:Urea ABC transporter permease subunit UrtB n=1 Tax=Lichenicoccus roseus TaxID=2683649 RepID=A0A5R9IZE9_9PROT|nr:urea ABC transporter permease subunit UrtB [Lichenicoccus roseus]TLU70835.1 urea ABC transporter permease subunit UrtB [Lichenicoccus roseus]